MNGRRWSGLCALALYASLGTAALAQPDQQPPGPRPDFAQMRLERFFAHLDPDRTGKITRTTFLADARAQFAAIDIDHAGKLTPSEIALVAERRHHAFRGMMPPGAPPAGMRPPAGMLAGAEPPPGAPPAGAPTGGAPRKPFPDVARDAGGNITLDAFLAAAGARFDAIDVRHTGTITVADFRAYDQAEMAKHPAPPPHP